MAELLFNRKAWTPLCQKTRQKRKTESENLHSSGFFHSHSVELRQNAELKTAEIKTFFISAGVFRARQPIEFVYVQADGFEFSGFSRRE